MSTLFLEALTGLHAEKNRINRVAHFRENNIENLQNAMLYFRDESISTNVTTFLGSRCLDTQRQDKLHMSHFQFLTNFN